MPISHRDYFRQGDQEHRVDIDSQQLAKVGPRLQVQIAMPRRLASDYGRQGKEIPQPIEGYALFDTGASTTSVDESILRHLELIPKQRINISTPSGVGPANIYDCAMSFPDNPMPDLELSFVVGVKLREMGYVALIGRDLMRDMVLIYDGPGARVTLAF